MTLRYRNQRGTALLLVLIILVIAVPAAVHASRLRGEQSLHDRLKQDARLTRDLLRASEPLVEHWLNVKSQNVVLPFDQITPRVPVAEEHWSAGDRECQLSITAWDLHGMVSIELLQRGMGFRSAIDAEFGRLIESHLGPGDLDGLDVFDPDEVHEINRLVFPTSLTEDQVALGGVVDFRRDQTFAVNVNTAPPALVSTALRASGRSGMGVIEAARSQGTPAVLREIESGDPEGALDLQLIGRSPAWAFRIDLQVGLASRSWWSVYENRGESWQCTQRIPILHE